MPFVSNHWKGVSPEPKTYIETYLWQAPYSLTADINLRAVFWIDTSVGKDNKVAYICGVYSSLTGIRLGVAEINPTNTKQAAKNDMAILKTSVCVNLCGNGY